MGPSKMYQLTSIQKWSKMQIDQQIGFFYFLWFTENKYHNQNDKLGLVSLMLFNHVNIIVYFLSILEKKIFNGWQFSNIFFQCSL